MEWIKAILEKHKDDQGVVDISKTMAEINAELPKHAVPKDIFNQKNDDLKKANDLLEGLKKDNKNVADLQKQIDDYEKQVKDLEGSRLKDKTNFTLKEKLREAGAKDIDYMLFKLGEVELDKEGNPIEIDNKIKSLKEDHASQFEVVQDGDKDKADNKGFIKVDDNKLDDGKDQDKDVALTAEVEKAMGIKTE